jgi:diphosphomevalonate decarboxylase
MAVMKKVQQWRDEGLQAGYTIDAGPNVHVICEAKKADEVAKLLKIIPGVQKVLVSPVGDGARIEG